MPFITAAIAAISAVGAFIGSLGVIGSFALQMAAGIGLSLIARAIAGKPKQEALSIQTDLASGGAVSRSFILGTYNTPGSLVYANTYGAIGETPNAFMAQVIALSDLPTQALIDVWVNGARNTLVGGALSGYRKNGADFLFYTFYDGTQMAVDSFLTSVLAGDARPWDSGRIGKGISYVILIAGLDPDKNSPLFSGIPQAKFTVKGLKLYDISKDSSVGGDGPQRWSDPSTWGGDGDDLPAVQIYNILRGISFDGKWVYGLQNLAAARLPADNWIAAVNKCRQAVDSPDGGTEPQYRSAAQINIDAPVGDVIESLLTACHGRLSEVGGVYKLYVGAPGDAALSFTDGDLLSTEEQSFTPFFGLADTINGINATYPEPAEGWNTKTAPPLYNTDYEAEDGGRRLMADVTLAAVPYAAQVQRLMRSALQEARRARRHTLALPPRFQVLEPGDIVSWTSARNGYEDKLFRVDGVVDKANLDVIVDMTEVDPSDYDWNPDTDYVAPVFAPMEMIRPAPQPIVDWGAEGQIVNDVDGLPRRPAILLSWDGGMVDIDGVEFEIRDGAATVVHRGRTDNAPAGSILVTQSLLPNSAYQARGRYIPSSPRETTWSDWLDCATPDVRFGVVEFDAALKNLLLDYNTGVQREIKKVTDRLGAIVAELDANTQLDKATLRRELARSAGQSRAFFTEQIDVAVGPGSAIASALTELGAQVDGIAANIQVRYVADADVLAGALASWTLNATVSDGSGETQAAGAIQVAAYDDGGGGAYSIARLDATRVLIGSVGATFQYPFIVDSTGDTPVITINGDLIAAGTITAPMIAAGAVRAESLDADVFTAVSANITNLTAANIRSDYAIKNVVDGLSSPVTLTCVIAHNDTAGAAPQTSQGVVKQSTYNATSGRVVFWAMVRTGNVNVSPGGDTQFQILKMKLDVIVYDASNNVLQTIPMRAVDGAYVASDVLKNIGASTGGGATVTPGSNVTVRIQATLFTTNLNTLSSQTTFNAEFADAGIVFFEPNGII